MMHTDSKHYAQAMLRLNPYHSAQRIVEQRARYLGLENQSSAKPHANAEQRRRKAEAEIAAIRAEFWTSPSPQIQLRLAALNIDGIPDLAASVARMARAAVVRPEIERLGAEQKVNEQFVDALRQIVVLPPVAARQKKDEQENQPWRWRNGPSAKKTVRFIKRNYPQIYQFEREWFDRLASARRSARSANKAITAERSSGNDHSWFWLFIVITTLFRILVHLLK